VIERDTFEHWNATLYSSINRMRNSWGYDSKDSSQWDDYNEYYKDDVFSTDGSRKKEDLTPIVPSSKYRCPPHPPDWITMRSESNYKFLWLHGNDNNYMSATAPLSTPLHHKSFEVVPVLPDCGINDLHHSNSNLNVTNSDIGWVRLRETDHINGFLKMIPGPLPSINKDTNLPEQGENPPKDSWTIHAGSSNLQETLLDHSYHFLLEEDGYLLNRGTNGVHGVLAFANVLMPDGDVRGHRSSQYDKNQPARREYSSMIRFQFINESSINNDRLQEKNDEKIAIEMDDILINKIQKFPKFTEKRIISFGLYGTNDKYTKGAIKNVQLAKIYFPGWICRFYVTKDVPSSIIDNLKELRAEIVDIPEGKGYTSGMFWRFMVASDENIDRYIIRDCDSRVNSRDAMAVQEWVNSGYKVHIMRDHANHCHTINGGMWGGVKGSLNQMNELINKWENRDEYYADMSFLADEIWPLIEDDQLSHDSYCCDKYKNARPFPSRRPPTYQHVGQVFDENDNARLLDIDGFIRGVPTPHSCRLNAEWTYG